MRYRLTAALATALLLACSPAASASAAAPTPSHPAAPDAGEDILVPLAGSSRWLIYSHSTSGSVAVLARSVTGEIRTLTVARSSDVRWSVIGHTVVAQRPDGLGTVDYWNLRTGRQRVFTDRSAAYYVSAARGGYFFWDRAEGLKRRFVATGKVASYGKVFHRYGYFTGFSGPYGVLIQMSDETAKYVPYARRHPAVALKTTATASYPVECTAINAEYASCWRFSDDDDYLHPTAALLVPLDGGKPTIATTCPGVPSVTGKTIVWATSSGWNGPADCETPSRRLDSLTRGESEVMRSATAVSGPTTSAYGLAIFTTPNGNEFLAASDATHSKRLPLSP